MSRSKRRTEKLFNRLLWVVAILFAFFLTGIGERVISDLPLVTERLEIENFYQEPEYSQLLSENSQLAEQLKAQELVKNGASEALTIAQLAYNNEKEIFENWLKTREATLDPKRDTALMTRTEALEVSRNQIAELERENLSAQKEWQAIVSKRTVLLQKINTLTDQAWERYYQADRRQVLQIFLIRLAVTLPLLVIAGYLFVKRRNGRYWPFSWGFIFFALFAFFFELVPYLPSYGGYVRFSVGLILTFLGGYYAIRTLNRYREKQRQEESATDVERRKMLNYSFVLQRLDKSLCPSCERGINYRDPSIDYCPHCGITLYKRCPTCHVRKNAFLNFCPTCGTKEEAQVTNE